MNMRVLSAIAVAFIFIFIFGWVFHGILLADHYAALSDIYRPQDEMQQYMAWLLGGQLMVAIALVLLLNLHSDRLNMSLGVKFGLLLGLMSAGSQVISYSVIPFTQALLGWWLIGSLVQMTVLGALLADILKEE